MAKAFSAALTAAKNRHHSGDPLIWLYRIEVDGTPANDLRLANYHRDLSYDQGDGSGVQTFTKSALVLADISERDGTLENVNVSVQNVDRDAANRIIQGEMLDRRVTIMLISLSDIATAGHHDEQRYSVRKATISEKVATFTLGQFPYFVFVFPSERHLRDQCPFVHEGVSHPVFDGRCGPTAALATCDKSFFGVGGCSGNNNQARYGADPELAVGPHPLLP
jgi:hypothetical protein